MTRGAVSIVALSLAPVAAAQDVPTRADLANAAGYVAQFTCSATFNGGKSPAQITADELTNIYPDYAPAMKAIGEADIEREGRTVSVSYADDMPPRIAVYRPHLGCSSLPQGATEKAAKRLPRAEVAAPSYGDMAWPTGDRLPNEDGLSDKQRDALDAVVDEAFAGGFDGVTSAVVVVMDGRVVAERYKVGFTPETSQRTWSVAKSIGATVVGAAVHDKIIKTEDDKLLDAWSRPGDPRADITLDDLLRMASGLNSDPAGNRTDAVYFGGGLVAQHATAASLDAKPGTRWRYANNDTMLALRALREAMDDDERFHAYPFTEVLHRIGMTRTVPETDWGGDFVLSSQVWTTARDLARLGMLYLQDGVWEGERILPEGWAAYASAESGPQPYGETPPEDGSYRGYGAQFWTYHYPGVPTDTYAALGNRGQFVIVVPSEETVIVRRGYDYAGERFDGPAFTAAVLEALR